MNTTKYFLLGCIGACSIFSIRQFMAWMMLLPFLNPCWHSWMSLSASNPLSLVSSLCSEVITDDFSLCSALGDLFLNFFPQLICQKIHCHLFSVFNFLSSFSFSLISFSLQCSRSQISLQFFFFFFLVFRTLLLSFWCNYIFH